MDTEMEEDTIEFTTFTVFEIDLDYEFDAARYFDFSRAESIAEARQAELWFASAATCPPSRKCFSITFGLDFGLFLFLV